MKIRDKEIITPADSAVLFAPDWRWQIANSGIAMRDLPTVLWGDKMLKNCLRYRAGGKLPAETTADFAIAEGLHASAIRWLIEPALVTSAPYDIIAGFVGTTTSVVHVYGDLFYAVRGPHGIPLPLVAMRIRLTEPEQANSIEAVFKRAADTGGIRMMARVLSSQADMADAGDDLDVVVALANRELLRRVLTQELSAVELQRISASGLLRERLRLDSTDGEPMRKARAAVQTAMDVLKLFAPELVEQETMSIAGHAEQDGQLRAHLEAQRYIAGGGLPAGALDEASGKQLLEKAWPKGTAISNGTPEPGVKG